MLSEFDKKDTVICFIGHQISVSEVRFDNIFVFRFIDKGARCFIFSTTVVHLSLKLKVGPKQRSDRFIFLSGRKYIIYWKLKEKRRK